MGGFFGFGLFSFFPGFFRCLFTVALVFGFFPFGGGEFAVYVFQEWREVVERFEIEAPVDGHGTLVVDGVAVGQAVFQFHAALPGIVGRVVPVHGNPGEGRNLVKRHLIGGCHVLLVVERGAEAQDAMFHGVFPHLVLVGVEVFVHRHVRFFDFRMGG